MVGTNLNDQNVMTRSAAETAPPAKTMAEKALRNRAEGRIRSRTLVLIRWIAIAGQTGAVLFVHWWLNYSIPFGWCLIVIAASAWLNVFLLIRDTAPKRLDDQEAGLYLAYDILQLGALFYLTGGIENPFMLLFLVPVTISATILTLTNTVALGVLSVACVSLLSIYHLPLPWGPEGIALPALYNIGNYVAVVLGTIFLGVYAWRISDEGRRLQDALAATQMALSREQKMSALGGLAAAAAHELGTPLGTITLIARELRQELGEGEYGDDFDLLVDQANRCREILSGFSKQPEQGDMHYQQILFEALAEEAAEPYKMQGKVLDMALLPPEGESADEQPYIRREPEIVHGLGNFVENAVDFAKSRVRVEVSWTDQHLRIRVMDDGPGFPVDILDRIGDPYVSTRGRDDRASKPQKSLHDGTAGHEGMGLGVFIAKTLLERTGAKVKFMNGKDEGAVVAVTWPRAVLESAMPMTGDHTGNVAAQ